MRQSLISVTVYELEFREGIDNLDGLLSILGMFVLFTVSSLLPAACLRRDDSMTRIHVSQISCACGFGASNSSQVVLLRVYRSMALLAKRPAV